LTTFIDNTETIIIESLDPTTAFQGLEPHQILDAIDAVGWQTDGRVSALNSYENRVYSIGLESGDSIVAKFYRPARWEDDAILEEHAFCDALEARDLPVISPLKSAAGQSLHHYGPYRFSVYPRAGGRPPELDNPEQLAVIGRTIGRLHLVSDTFPFQYRPTIDAFRFGDDCADFLLDSDIMPVEQAWGSDNTPHLLDFDDAASGPAMQDLWMFISGDRQYAQARLADLLDGYHEFRRFDEREIALIEPLRTLRIIHYAAWIARRWKDPAFVKAFPFFAHARFWDEHIQSLREQRVALNEPWLVY